MASDELRVAEYLLESGLRSEPFSSSEKQKGKTPDFRVFRCDEFAFFCEVKGISRDGWLDGQLEKVPKGQLAGGLRPDPIYNRLSSKIHEAVKQFDAVNPGADLPNVLVLVNHDDLCDWKDLISVTTGKVLTDDGRSLDIFRKYSEGRIRDERWRIHLYIWLDDFKDDHKFFNMNATSHKEKLCEYFTVDPDTIQTVSC